MSLTLSKSNLQLLRILKHGPTATAVDSSSMSVSISPVSPTIIVNTPNNHTTTDWQYLMESWVTKVKVE